MVSNIPPGDDGTAGPDVPTECRPAQADEVRPALAMVLSADAAPADDGQVRDFIELAARRHIDLADLWVARRNGRLAWAILPIASPGKTVLFVTAGRWPAGLEPGPLVEGMCHAFARRGTHLAQALLDPGDAAARELFAAHGFREMAELIYLNARVARPPQPPPPLPDGMAWHTYGSQSHALFARAILDSYRQSLDCPALNGLRDVEDIIAGHRASGEFDPAYWFALAEHGAPAGVLLLNRVPRTDGAELVYFGLAPAARGRGLGDLAMRQARWATRQMGAARLSLAVDAQNAPALGLYYRHGFQRIGHRVAMMRDLRATP